MSGIFVCSLLRFTRVFLSIHKWRRRGKEKQNKILHCDFSAFEILRREGGDYVWWNIKQVSEWNPTSRALFAGWEEKSFINTSAFFRASSCLGWVYMVENMSFNESKTRKKMKRGRGKFFSRNTFVHGMKNLKKSLWMFGKF